MQMRSFEKMAKEKKVKVLLIVISLCLLNWIYAEAEALDVPKLMHIIKHGASGLEGVCIASETDAYTATDWTYPIAKDQEDQPQIITYFLPNLTNDFDCNFEKDSHCADQWKSNVWRIPEDNNKSYEPIFDYRWEDFKTYLITNDTPILGRRIDIPNDFNITLSIRTESSIGIWLCEGWLPDKHPCYTISVGTNSGKLISVIDKNNKTLASNSSEGHILSFDQWKNLQISLYHPGILQIFDLDKNINLVNISNGTLLKPIYLFMNSDGPSLWKIHQNNFLYTDNATETHFGPIINVPGTNLCVSMFVAMCESCNLTFYLEKQNGTREVLLNVFGSDVKNWKHIKVHIQNCSDDRLQLFTKTEGVENPYWMIDNVRLCSPSEVKLKKLKNSGRNPIFNITDHEISCHALSKQQWRPKPYEMKPDVGFSLTEKTEFNTSVKLSWKPIRVSDKTLPFVLKYQGHHTCPGNFVLKNASLDRIRSNAVLLVKGNEVTVKNLIPYTHYSFSFIHPIYDNLTKEFIVNTNETETITEYERPKNVRIFTTSTSVKIIHDPPSCNDKYGRILYKYTVGDLQPILSEGTENILEKLLPFTNYTLKIETARGLAGLNRTNKKYVSYYNFTTKPDVAPPVAYLDVLETTKNSVSLRYKLANVTKGIPELVFVTYCNRLMKNKCDTVVENITRCPQYPNMYCVHITKLIRKEKYSFKLSIKNEDTYTTGKETHTVAVAQSVAPGKVSNLTYTVINCSESHEYCNFNISWNHPCDQRGSITAFNLELIEVGTNKGLDDIYLIKDREYKPRYFHIVRYLPYATTYDISVRARNDDYNGDFVTIRGKIDHIGEHIDQIPRIIKIWPDSLLVEIPVLDYRIEKAVLTVIVQSDVNEHIDEEYWKISNGSLCYQVGKLWIAKVLEFSKSQPVNFTIGDDTSEFSKMYNRTIINKKLLPDSGYCLTYVVQNTYRKVTHKKVYHWEVNTSPIVPEAEETSDGTYKVLITLLVLFVFGIIIGLVLYRFRHRLYCRKVRQDGEHIYEAMPFEEYNDVQNVVYNATYDKLVHD